MTNCIHPTLGGATLISRNVTDFISILIPWQLKAETWTFLEKLPAQNPIEMVSAPYFFRLKVVFAVEELFKIVLLKFAATIVQDRRVK